MTESNIEGFRNIRLCVDAYDDDIMEGQFYFTSLRDEGRQFSSLIQFLTDAERALDAAGFPQSYTAKRTFADDDGKALTKPGVERIQIGILATFDICLLFRQHASWQGTISWLESGQERSFRSVLEMLFLISSALHSDTAVAG